MGESAIGWLHPPPRAARVPFGTPGRPGYTLNAWIGCSKIDQECKFCYAEREAGRGRLPLFRERNAAGLPVWGNEAPRHIVSEATIRHAIKWNREAEADLDPRLVFGGSQMDWLEDRPELAAPRARLLELIAATPWLRWILLTKRPGNFAALVPSWRSGVPDNVWIGISAGSQPSLDAKLDDLERIPARVKIASVEPMIGPVDFARALRIRELVWFLFGGESGARAKVRPCDLGWIGRGVRQVGDAGRFRFVKQLGARPLGVPDCIGCEGEMHEGDVCGRCGDVVEVELVDMETRRRVEGRVPGDRRSYPEGDWQPRPGTGYARVLHLPGKGDDPALWPARLRVQEWPDGSAYEFVGAAC